MNRYFRKFLRDSEKVAFDTKHRKTIKFNMQKYNTAVIKGKKRFINIEELKQIAAQKKRLTLSQLDNYLLEFEKNFTSNNGEVLWAENNTDLKKHLIKIIQQNSASLVVKSKSMTTEEVDFNKFAQENNVESIESDLGEYIVQVAGEKPYHIVTPAMHKSRKDINDLFDKEFAIGEGHCAEYLTNFVREKLRGVYQAAEIGVTGANFLIADIGGIAVTENEGNVLFSTSFPKIHIVIAGIEKIIPSLKDLDEFWPLLSSHGTGQAVTAYNSVFTGPGTTKEDFGPKQMYVILLDNNRTQLLKENQISNSLSCIRCGACLNACPVYHNIGGYTYQTTYSGPIGSIITPYLTDFNKYSHLSYACTLCGKCTENCPVKINLHKYLLSIRHKDAISLKRPDFFQLGIKILKFIILNNFLFRNSIPWLYNTIVSVFFRNVFGKRRNLPPFKQNFTNTFN